jgi:hypothetical protein
VRIVPMHLRGISALARPIDLRYPTNRAIAALTMVAIVGEAARQLFTGADWMTSGKLGMGLGLAVFLAWAICREIDPDRDLAAFVAAGFALVGTVIWGLSGFGVLFWLLLIVRVLNRTTGLPATSLDSLGLLFLTVWLCFSGLWPFGAIAAGAFLLDGTMAPRHKRHIVFGIVTFVVAAVAATVGGIALSLSAPSFTSGAAALILCLLFVPVIRSAGNVLSVADDTQQGLISSRVRAGQVFALLVGMTAAFFAGTDGLVLVLPLWAAVVGASAFLLLKSVAK